MAIRELARTKPARSQRAVLPFILGPRLMPVMFCAAVGLSAIPASADPHQVQRDHRRRYPECATIVDL